MEQPTEQQHQQPTPMVDSSQTTDSTTQVPDPTQTTDPPELVDSAQQMIGSTDAFSAEVAGGLTQSVEDALRMIEDEAMEDDGGWLNENVERGWSKEFACYSSVNYHNSTGLERGDKIILPASALSELFRNAIDEDESPLLFEISSMASGELMSIPCGVLEFSATETTTLVPAWMMGNIMAQEGDIVTVKRVELPKATFIKFKSLSSNFNSIFGNRKNILEYELRRYTAMKKGSNVSIWHKGLEYRFEVLDVKPADSVSIHNTDVEVDFEESGDSLVSSSKLLFGTKQNSKEDATKENAKQGFEAFGGRGELQQSGSSFFANKDDSHYSICSNCETQVPKESIVLHEVNCFRNIFRCPECKTRFKKAEKEDHMLNYHGLEKCKCGKEMQKWRMEIHNNEECEEREIDCPYCGVAQTASSLGAHQNYCGARTEPCPLCHKFITLQDFAVHKESGCRVIPNKRSLKESVLICPGCFSPFIDTDELMDHIAICKLNNVSSETNLGDIAAPMDISAEPSINSTTAPTTTTTVPSPLTNSNIIDDIMFCPYCNDPFIQFDELEVHCATKHPNS